MDNCHPLPVQLYTQKFSHGVVVVLVVVLDVVELVVLDDELLDDDEEVDELLDDDEEDDELLELVVLDDELDELVVVVEPPSSWQNVYPTWFISVPLYAGGPEHSQPCPQFFTINTQVDPFH